MTSAYSSRILSVFAPSLSLAGARNQVISKQRPAPGAVDQNVSGFEHRHRVLRRHDGGGALHRIRAARIDQIADRALDGVERAEPQRPVLQKLHQVRRNGLSERKALVELGRIEDGPDAVAVDGVGSVALDGIRDEVRRELDHPRARVLVPLLVEPNREPLHRLEQRREQEPHGSCADDVHSSAGRQGLQSCGLGSLGHWPSLGEAHKEGTTVVESGTPARTS